MTSTKAFLSLAALLSALAGIAALLTPPPPPPPTGTPRAADDGLSVEAHKSHGYVHVDGSDVYVDVAVQLPAEERHRASNVSLALVLDRSGSMDGAKMADAKRAAHRLVHLLGPDDELGLVHFGTDVEVVPRRKMDEAGQAAMDAAIDAVQVNGSTNVSDALTRGQALLAGATGTRRLVLVSDGQPTAGDVTPEGLTHLAGALHEQGVTITALGVGTDYDGPLMQHLAERGGGMYGYLASAAQLEDILGRELAAARASRVRNLELSLDLSSGLQLLESPGRLLERQGRATVLHLADLQPGTTTHAWLHLRSSRLAAGSSPSVRATVTWTDLEADREHRATVDVPFVAVADAATFEASRDEAVFTQAVTAMGTVQLAAAAAAYERGDDALGFSLLGNARSLFGMSADALAGESETLDRVGRDMVGATPEQRKHVSKSLEKKFLSNFGRENEGY